MGANPILTGGGVSPQAITEVVSGFEAARHPVGTRAQLPDGRVFYYTRNSSTALDPGKLTMAEVTTSDFANQAVAVAAAANATSVRVTLGATAVTYDEYAEGYLVINDAAGEGHQYKIRGHIAASGAAAVTLELYDGIQVALTTSSQYTLQKNLWADAVVAAAGHAHFANGVPNMTVSVGTADVPTFFWNQTWGVCPVWDLTTTAIGSALESGDTNAGQVAINDGTAQHIGVQLYAGVLTEYYPKFLTIAP